MAAIAAGTMQSLIDWQAEPGKDSMTSIQELANTVRDQNEELERLRLEVQAWRERYEQGEKRGILFANSSRELQPLYTALDTAGSDPAQLGMPGAYPYTRGIHPTGYRGRLWTM